MDENLEFHIKVQKRHLQIVLFSDEEMKRFQRIPHHCSRFSPKVSYFEIYMDKIRDLLDGESVYFVSGRPKYRLQRIISKPN